MNTMQMVEEKDMRKDLESFAVGDPVTVHVQGDIIAKRGAGMNASFTVRKISFGIGVERVFPLHSRSIKKIEIVRQTKVRRAKLYYLRSLKGKAARLRGDQH